jgi:tight adherence protein B
MLLPGSALLGGALVFLFRWALARHEARLRKLQEEYLAFVRQGLAREFVFVEPGWLKKRLAWALILGAGVSVVTWSPLPCAAAAILGGITPYALLGYVKTRRKKLFEKQLAEALPQLSSILKAGHTFERALESLSRTSPNPLGQELQLVLKELQMGVSLSTSLDHLLSRFSFRDLEIVVRAVQMSRRVGTNLKEVFDRVGEMMRERAKARERLSALTAQGRMQAWIAIAMPVLLVVPLEWVSPGYLDPLWKTGTGRLVVLICALFLVVGGVWVHKISRAEVFQ